VTKSDHAQLATLLAELAECFDRRQLSAAAVKHWIDSLHEFPWSSVQSALLIWRDRKRIFPSISDIREPLADQAITDREVAAQASRERFERETERTLSGPTADGLRIMDSVKRALGAGKPDEKQWARDIVDAYVDRRPLVYRDILTGELREVTGKPISVWQLQLACGALGLSAEKIIRDSRS